MTRALPLLLIAALALPAAAPAADEMTAEWGDPSQSASIAGSPLRPPLRVRWRVDHGNVEGGGTSTNVLVTGGRIVYARGSSDGLSLTALDPADGHILWSTSAYGFPYLAADAGRVFLVTQASGGWPSGIRAVALDLATGNEIWRRDLAADSVPIVTPVADGGQLFFLGGDNNTVLYALRQSDGGDLWPAKTLANGNQSTPALDDGSVYVSLSGHHTFAFSRADGTERWRNQGCCPGGIAWTTAVHDGRFYGRGGLAYDVADGRIVDETPSTWVPSFAGDTGVEVWEGIRGFGPGFRTTRWTSKVPFGVDHRPLLAGGHAYLSGRWDGSDGDVMALRLSDGAPVWCPRIPLSPAVDSPAAPRVVAAGHGLLLVATGESLIAFESGGEPAPCSPDGGPPNRAPPDRTSRPADPSVGAVRGPALTMRVGARQVWIPRRTRVTGRLAGLRRVDGRTVALDVDPWPFDGRFRRAARARTRRGGNVAFWLRPRRNVQVRLRLARAPGTTSAAQTVWADYPVRIVRRGAGGRRPRLHVTVLAPRRAAIRGAVVHAYLARRGAETWRRVGGRRWGRGGPRSASIVFRYPRGSLGRRDRALVCTREEVPDAFGQPHRLERVCGDPTMPRGRR